MWGGQGQRGDGGDVALFFFSEIWEICKFTKACKYPGLGLAMHRGRIDKEWWVEFLGRS